MIDIKNPRLCDPSFARADYYEFGRDLYKELEYYIDWSDFKIISDGGKYHYIAKTSSGPIILTCDPVQSVFYIILENGNQVHDKFDSYDNAVDFLKFVNSFISRVKEIGTKSEEYKPGETRIDKRKKEAKTTSKETISTGEFATTMTATTGLNAPIMTGGGLPATGSEPVKGGQAPRTMKMGPTEKPKQWTGQELSNKKKVNEEIYEETVIRNGVPVKKHFSDQDNKKIVYDKDGKPEEKTIKQSEHTNKENGQRAGQVKRDAKMDSIQAKQKSSLSKRSEFWS